MRSRKQNARAKRIKTMAAEILDVTGAATLLGVSRRTVYKLVSKRAIPATKVGKEWRFSRKRLIDWVGGASPERSEGQTLEELFRNGTARVLPPRG